MRQQLLVYSGYLEVVEYPGVVVYNDILVKPLYVYISDLERGILRGDIPFSKPIVLGSTGVVRVVEVMSGSTEYTGKVYTVSPLGSRGVLGVEENGLLASFTSLHSSYLDEPLVNPVPQDSLRPLVKHSVELAQLAGEPVLVEGCGILGIATGLALRYLGVEPTFYCEEARRNALIYDFTTASHISELSSKWRTVVVTSVDAASKYRVLFNTEYSKLIISRLSFTTWIPLKKSQSSLEILVGHRGDRAEPSIVKRVVNEVGRHIKVHALSNLENSRGLFPPRGLGSILSLD